MKIYNNIDDLKQGLKSNFKSNNDDSKDINKLKNDKGYYNKKLNQQSISNANELKAQDKLIEKNDNNFYDIENNSNIKSSKKEGAFCSDDRLNELENYDKLKTKVLKYVVYKKRTENEIYKKFSKEIENETLEKIIDELKQNRYINDNDYINRAVNEFMALRNLSLWEIKYKLISKGIKSNLIDDYFSLHEDELKVYEEQSAKNIAIKKHNLDKIEIKKYLIKKGYKEESIKFALSEEL